MAILDPYFMLPLVHEIFLLGDLLVSINYGRTRGSSRDVTACSCELRRFVLDKLLKLLLLLSQLRNCREAVELIPP